MGHYIKLSLKEVQEILELYNIVDIKAIDPQSLGISNTNYKITTSKETLLLKVSNDKNIEQLAKEQDILHFLKEKNFSLTIAPLSLPNGAHVYEFRSYFGAIFPFLNGKAPKINPENCEEIGKALGALHALSTRVTPLPKNIRHCSEVGYDARKILDYIQTSSSCPSDFLQCFHQAFPDGLNQYFQQNLEQGLIHGDLYYDNTLFLKNKLVTLLDFEQAGIGEYLFDLGVSLSGSCLEDGVINLHLIESFIKGYQKERILPEAEKYFLKDAILVGLFSISLWRIKRFTEGSLDPLKTDSYKELLRRAELFQKLSLPSTF